MKILVRAPNWIGDQILAYPFFYWLRQSYPEAQITVVCVDWVLDIQFRASVNEIHVLPRAGGAGKWERFRLLEEVAGELKGRGPWDLGISLPNSFSAAWLLYRSGCRERRGYGFEGRGFLLTDRRDFEELQGIPRAESYLRLAFPKEAKPESLDDFFPKLPENNLDEPVPGVVDHFNSVAEWGVSEALSLPRGDYWILAPGSQAESRRWPLEYFSVLARRIAQSTDLQGVIVGGPLEAPLASRLCADLSLRLLDRTAQGPLPRLSGLFSSARFSVVNDSGLAHLSALHGCTTFVVWGAGDPRHTKPLGPGRVQLIFNPIECWPCERNTCFQLPAAQLQCLKGIQADSVFEEIRRVVRGTIPFRD